MFRPTTVLWQISAPQLFKVSLLGSTVAALILSTGCSSTPTRTQTTIHPKQVSSNPSDYLDASSLDSLEDLLSATDMRAVEGDRLLILKHGDVWKRMTVGFKMDEGHWDPRIDAQRNWFISRQPYLDRLSARASRYLYHTVKEAERRGMPTELALLPVIESSYDPAATSSASATGLWQFIPSTGKIYGLQQTNSYDARRDVVESTRAAYEFLGSLYNQFGSWELALAAYNAGPGRVQQAINRNASLGLPTDYWSLKLPAETMNYVPRFLAVAQIVKNPRAYGVTLPPIANRPHFREIQIQPGVSMTQIADLSGLSRTELYALNPGYRGEYVDTDSPGRILIPSDVSPAVDRRLMALKGTGYTGNNTWQATVPVKANVITQPVIVGSSTPIPNKSRANTPANPDALAAFANNADVPSAPRIPVAVTTANDLKRPINTEPPISIHERDRILAEIKADDAKETVRNVVQPVADSAEQLQVINEIKAIAPAGTQVVDPLDGKIKLTAIQTSQSVADSEGKEVTKSFSYPKNVVDTVAQDSDDAKRNKDRDYIKTDTDVVAVTPKGERSTYTVVSGDTLATIAMKNGVNWRDIAKWNQIDPNASLYVGNTLYLYDAKPQSTPVEKPDSYIVKANDSLTGVASQFDLSVKDLADWNNLSTTSNLMIGQKLILKAPKEKEVTEPRKATKVKTQVYNVKRGEYLKLIADRYGLSNQALADLTPDLSPNDSLRVGQKINVPLSDDKEQSNHREQQISSEAYKVKRGDTLNSIATKSNISLNELAKLNHVRSNFQVRVGQVIQVPEGTQTPTEYTVKSGDTLSNIASRYNLQLEYLAHINGLSKSSGVRIGQRLKLDDNDIDDNGNVVESQPQPEQRKDKEKTSPHSDKQTENYTVQSGESLHIIAARYGITVKELATMNDLTIKTSLRRGQVLDVPKKTIDYKVRSGDNLIRLANKYGIEPKELATMNDLQPNAQLRLGTIIQVPNK